MFNVLQSLLVPMDLNKYKPKWLVIIKQQFKVNATLLCHYYRETVSLSDETSRFTEPHSRPNIQAFGLSWLVPSSQASDLTNLLNMLIWSSHTFQYVCQAVGSQLARPISSKVLGGSTVCQHY